MEKEGLTPLYQTGHLIITNRHTQADTFVLLISINAFTATAQSQKCVTVIVRVGKAEGIH